MSNRDTARYTIRSAKGIEKYGITNDLERRALENASDGVPGNTRKEGPLVTRESALKWEADKIDQYEQRNGKLPRYNKPL